ncbi:crotonyl-CoA carboxylase/reductase [Dokdonia sp.]|uniref:crotonyl-CoA carboxylase/reductase n=1 Tax=Dokdonia sp. TaxID=2024995 RepID=UPI003264C3CA
MKQLFNLNESPELGTVPSKMYAYVIKPDNHGAPMQSLREEVIETPQVGFDEVLIKVKSVGINYNGLWAALGSPVSPTKFHGRDFHIAGSDAAGVIWKVGEGLINNPNFKYSLGDEVIIHCGQSCGLCDECNGGNTMLCSSQKIYGYETPYGSFAQYTAVKASQLLRKPKHLKWDEAGSYMLTYATAWKMLFGHAPNILRPGMNVLVWGASGGLGSAAIQLIKIAGANAIAVTSSTAKGKQCMELGAVGYINRKNFDCWGELPSVDDKEAYASHVKEMQKFGKAIWEITGKNVNPDIVFEHVGKDTFPTSCYVVKTGGMVVFCGATSGFNLSMDASYIWMRQKRIQGSHFSSLKELSDANKLVENAMFTPVISKTYPWDELPLAHLDMLNNSNQFGNAAVVL